MSVNLIELIKPYLNDDIIQQIAGLLGENSQTTQTALSGALPALLGGVMNSASSADGAGSLLNMLNNQDSGLLDNLGGMLGGSDQGGLLETGGGILKSLFGDKVGGIADAVSQFSGMNKGSASSLLGMIAPVVMGVIGKQSRSEGLDAGGLMNLLGGQKDHIAQSMPQEFSSVLQQAGIGGDFLKNIIGGVGDAVDSGRDAISGAADRAADAAGRATDAAAGAARGAADAASDAAGRAAGAPADAADATASAAAQAAKSGSSMLRRILPIVILVILAVIIFQFWSNSQKEETDTGMNQQRSPAVTADTHLS